MMRASKCSAKWVGWIAVGLIAVASASQPAIAGESSSALTQGGNRINLVEQLDLLLSLDPDSDLQRIAETADQLATDASAALQENKSRRRESKSKLAELPLEQVKDYFWIPLDLLNPQETRGVGEIARLSKWALAQPESDRVAAIVDLRVMLKGVKNVRRSPVPASTGALSPWKLWFQNSNRTIGHGRSPAANLVKSDTDDLSLADPLPAGFWKKPSTISNSDLGVGFDRTELPIFTNRVWKYDKPKSGAGTRPGFEIKADGQHYKVKLGEVSSEPFTARIFHALGYNVDPTDYAAEVKVQYDRRIFREFNLRKPLFLRLRPFWIPVATLNLQPYCDPFAFTKTAVFKDGTTVTGAELKTMLLKDVSRPHPEEDPQNYRTEIESSLDYVIFGPANMQSEDASTDSIGSWDFGGLGQEDRRELRGAGLLAAWLGWFDSRFDNTRLRTVGNGDRTELRYFFTDLGSGMGRGTGWFIRHGEDPDAMEWTFTRPEIVRGPGRMTTPFRVINFDTIVPTPAFQKMTKDDARWMARMIGQLTRDQLRSALMASGYNETETAIYLEKLVSRRNRMIHDLGLSNEFPDLEINSPSPGVISSLPATPRASAQ